VAASSFPDTYSPRLGLGMTSLVLGTVGLLLAFLPVLGVPISAFGLLFGILGLIGAMFFTGATLRWSVAGIFISSLALAVNIAITYAPRGYLPSREVPKSWQPVRDRPWVPPPSP
jgi:hypothetical protein